MNYTNQATRPTMTISTIHMNLEEKLILHRIVVSTFYCIGIYFRVYKLDNMHDDIFSKKSKMITANMFMNKNNFKLILCIYIGVGKSYLIKLLSQFMHLILSSWGDVTEYPKLIRLAFTGAAAYLIGKFDKLIINP